MEKMTGPDDALYLVIIITDNFDSSQYSNFVDQAGPLLYAALLSTDHV